MRTAMHFRLIAALAIAAVFVATGCGGDVTKSDFDAVKKQSADSAKQLKDLNTQAVLLGSQLKDLQKKLDDMQTNVNAVSSDVATLMTKGGVSPEANKALDQRLGAIEAGLQKAHAEVAALRERGGEAKEAAGAPAPAKTVKPAPVRTQASVTWHLLKQGETLESVAKHYGVSAAAIRAKNNIPSGRTVPAGNRIMIPQP